MEQTDPKAPLERIAGRVRRDFRIGRNAAFLGLDRSKQAVLLFSVPLESISGKSAAGSPGRFRQKKQEGSHG